MIIECPACATRYDIKAELPPLGRTVRCAKCGTVWRAMPETGGGEEAEPNGPSWMAPSAKSEAPVGAAKEAAARGGVEDGAQRSREHAIAAEEAAAAKKEIRFAEEAIGYHAGSDEDEDEDEASAENENAGKVSWFSNFRRKAKATQPGEGEEPAAKALMQAGGETIPFPRAHFPAAQQPAEPRQEQYTLDSARQAVRRVFSNIAPGGSAVTAELAVDRARLTAPEAATSHDDPAERLSGHGQANGESVVVTNSEADGGHRADAEGDDAWLEDEKEDDPVAALREAMLAHFPSSVNRTAPLADEELAAKLETHFKATAATAVEEKAKRGVLAGLWGKRSRRADEEMFEPEPAEAVEEPLEEPAEEPVETKDGDADFDQRLYREIEETQEKSGAVLRRRRRGGLALAAAWGLFLCVAGGLIAGFFGFRDIIADAAPGLAPLYRTLGMPVTLQPLVFDEVRYEWSMSDNKPVLTISGSVFNRAHRKVRVPEFFIAIKDEDSALDREYSANLKISGSKIRSNERADFDIELVSPNPTITAVELELRNVR